METITQILASFDIFQVLISAFPQIFLPLAHAFTSLFHIISETAAKEFASHPGIISGSLIFITIYVAWSGLTRALATISKARKVPQSVKEPSIR